jgi:hypothetical protein
MNARRPHKTGMRLKMAGSVEPKIPIFVIDEFSETAKDG